MATPSADDVLADSSSASQDCDSLILPNLPISIGAASYEKYLQGCVESNLGRPHLVTPELVNASYFGWLSDIGDTEEDRIRTVFGETHSAGAFRLWCENECRKAGYATRYGFKQLGLGKWAIAAGTVLPSTTIDEQVFRMPSKRSTSRLQKRIATTNYIYDIFCGKVFILPAFFKRPLWSVDFEEFYDAFKSINSQFEGPGILSRQRIWRVFRAFVEIAFAFAAPEAIEIALRQARVCSIMDGCLDFDTLTHPSTGEPLTKWNFDMILLPHCIRYSQLPPQYDEFCRATQAINPYFLISEHLMAEAWTAVFDCRVELGNMPRKAADLAIASAFSPYAKLYWDAAARIDAKFPPLLQRRPAINEYDSLFDYVYPTYPANRMIAVDKVGDGLVIPLSPPPWCLRPGGEEFASFTMAFEWLNPGVTREQVVSAWTGLGWEGRGINNHTSWARLETIGSFATSHWDPAIVELDKQALQQEQELRNKLAELSSTPAPRLLRTSQLQPLPIERTKTGWQPSQVRAQHHHKGPPYLLTAGDLPTGPPSTALPAHTNASAGQHSSPLLGAWSDYQIAGVPLHTTAGPQLNVTCSRRVSPASGSASGPAFELDEARLGVPRLTFLGDSNGVGTRVEILVFGAVYDGGLSVDRLDYLACAVLSLMY